MTTKQDLWDAYPFGMLAVPRSQVIAVHGSSGTGGRPTLVAYTRDDLKLWARMCARALGCAGGTPDSVVHNAYGYGLFTGGLGIHQGAIELGATVVPASAGMTSRQVTLVRDLRPDILTCTPSYALRLGEALGPGSGPCAPASRKCSAFARLTSTGCRRSSVPAWPPSAWRPPTAHT
jgi:phenylacetate-coenzyme A ligase PaaK-like adenylate-forming protein